MGGARLDGSLDDQIFAGIALLDAYEATLDRKYFDAARRAADFAIAEYFDAEGGGFFDRASGAPPMGGLEVRRKPLQDSPTPGANSSAAILLDRLHGYTGDARYRDVRGSDARSVCRHRAAIWDSRRELRACRAAACAPAVRGRHHRQQR